MPIFEITFFVEPTVRGDPEVEIVEVVEAEDLEEAMVLARRLHDEMPEIDAARTATWTIEMKPS